MDNATKKAQKKYDRFSKFYDFFEEGMERKRFKNWRKQLLENLKGNILDVGVGTGKNLSHYNKDARVVGIDLSPKMLAKAKNKLKILNNKNIKLEEMDAQKLKFKDNSFDYVVCTFVLCSVPDPVKVVKEMKRILKNNGKIFMLEHTKSDYFLIKVFQYLHNPITRALIGVDIKRDTIGNIKKAGLNPKYTNIAFLDVFKRIEVINEKKGGK